MLLMLLLSPNANLPITTFTARQTNVRAATEEWNLYIVC